MILSSNFLPIFRGPKGAPFDQFRCSQWSQVMTLGGPKRFQSKNREKKIHIFRSLLTIGERLNYIWQISLILLVVFIRTLFLPLCAEIAFSRLEFYKLTSLVIFLFQLKSFTQLSWLLGDTLRHFCCLHMYLFAVCSVV